MLLKCFQDAIVSHIVITEYCPILKRSHYEPHHEIGSYKCLLATFLDSGHCV
jgi:hypothetical protein